MSKNTKTKAYFNLPGLFEFCDFYRVFLKVFVEHREYFYNECEIGSIYGAPAACLWGGGRVGYGDNESEEVLKLMTEFGIPARLTFSNSLIREEHLSDKRCNSICELFKNTGRTRNGVIVHSDLLLSYLKEKYPEFTYTSSTTKVIRGFGDFLKELRRDEFEYVVPDFRLNREFELLGQLSQNEKDKVEFLCNECCSFACRDRKECYENVSRKSLGEDCGEHLCSAPDGGNGYRFSKAMENPGFIGIDDIREKYLPMGFSNFKIEGRGLGSSLILEFILYYLTKPEYHIHVRELVYLDSMLDLF